MLSARSPGDAQTRGWPCTRELCCRPGLPGAAATLLPPQLSRGGMGHGVDWEALRHSFFFPIHSSLPFCTHSLPACSSGPGQGFLCFPPSPTLKIFVPAPPCWSIPEILLGFSWEGFMKHCPGGRTVQSYLLWAFVFQDGHPGTRLPERRCSGLSSHTVH